MINHYVQVTNGVLECFPLQAVGTWLLLLFALTELINAGVPVAVDGKRGLSFEQSAMTNK
ncbi:hypothetical protein JMJ77_0010399 [Colletotrichum scovillei]|uniref:Uncharacterized protein n=1 Tax=Colletotrichum scovillei TaxID=1209932 RepID=A0A9P7QUB2_9PEZI|nr:hypothetical protein JMJ78_0011774 [Colletotrichum scovillei]KAG7042299.1 hypothetical protein JMJ77_0010399 [Colletotrichum scovillei]KAG7062332.1 hypothetical protein JMJ76_0006607 [Colletotrichum scovillei]